MITVRWNWRQLGLGYLLIAWIGVAFYLTNVLEPNMRLKLSYEEQVAQVDRNPLELERLREAVIGQYKAIDELGGELRRVKCQINIVVAASRSGWRKADRLMRTGEFIETCGTEKWDAREVIAVSTDE